MDEYISSKTGGTRMKRILITVILTIICFGIGVTSFAVNDLSNLTTWYRVEVRPAIKKAYHDKKQEKTEDRKDKERESDKKYQEDKLFDKKSKGKEENMNISKM